MPEIPQSEDGEKSDSAASNCAESLDGAQDDGHPDDVEERDLRAGLARAGAEGAWGAVEILNRRLEELLRRRAAVIDLGAERSRRKGR